MKNFKKLLFAVMVAAVAVLSTPAIAQPPHWCRECDRNGDCYACCKCDGGTTAYCGKNCP